MKWESHTKAISNTNETLCLLDSLCIAHEVEKIKTFPYLVVTGCPEKDPYHCIKLAEYARDVLINIQAYNKKFNKQLKIRIGIHTGKINAAILGYSKFLYDIFGDTVNFTSRLTSSAEWNTIQLSQVTANKLLSYKKEKFDITEKGEINLKGKGLQKVYLLNIYNSEKIIYSEV